MRGDSRMEPPVPKGSQVDQAMVMLSMMEFNIEGGLDKVPGNNGVQPIIIGYEQDHEVPPDKGGIVTIMTKSTGYSYYIIDASGRGGDEYQ